MAYVSRYLLNDNAANTTVVDDEGNNNGVFRVNTESSSVSGKNNRALNFNGVGGSNGDKVTINTSFSPPFSFGAWVYWEGSEDNMFVMMTNGYNYPTNKGWMLRYDSAGLHPFKGIYNGAVAYTWPINTWVHCVVTVAADGIETNTYINKQLKLTWNGVFSNGDTEVSYLGMEHNSQAGFILPFNGILDNCFYTNTELTQPEIAAIYDAELTSSSSSSSSTAPSSSSSSSSSSTSSSSTSSSSTSSSSSSSSSSSTSSSSTSSSSSSSSAAYDDISCTKSHLRAVKITTSSQAECLSIRARIRSLYSGYYGKAILYNDDTGYPGAFVAVSGATSITQSPTVGVLHTFTFSPYKRIEANTYWLVVVANASDGIYLEYDGLTGESYDKVGSDWYANPPDPYPLEATSGSYNFETSLNYNRIFGNIRQTGADGFGVPKHNLIVSKYILQETGYITSVVFRYSTTPTTSGYGKLVIYDDSAGYPNVLKWQSSAFVLSASLGANVKEVDIASPVNLTAGDYWVGLICDQTGGIYLKYTSLTGRLVKSKTNSDYYASLPNPYPAGADDDTKDYEIYVHYTLGSSSSSSSSTSSSSTSSSSSSSSSSSTSSSSSSSSSSSTSSSSTSSSSSSSSSSSTSSSSSSSSSSSTSSSSTSSSSSSSSSSTTLHYPVVPVPDYPLVENLYYDVLVTDLSGESDARTRHTTPVRSWRLNYHAIHSGHCDYLWNFYKARKGSLEKFYWTHPETNTTYWVRFTDNIMKRDEIGENLFNMTVELVEVI